MRSHRRLKTMKCRVVHSCHRKLRHAERYSAEHLGVKAALFSPRDPSRSTAQDDTLRRLLVLAMVLLTTGTVWAQTRPSGPKDLEAEMPADAHRLKIGDAAPDFSLKG